MQNDLWTAINKCLGDLRVELNEERESGIKYAEAENAYQREKHIRALELQAEGQTATMINLLLKGDPAVSSALLERDSKKVLYESSRSKVNAIKLQIRVLEGQLQREWSIYGNQ